MQKNRFNRNQFLSGTGEKLLLLVLWLGIVLSRAHLIMQLVFLLVGIIILQWSTPNNRYRWKVLFVAAAFIFMSTIGLVLINGKVLEGALVQFQVAGSWWSITEGSVEYSGLTALKALNGLIAIQFAIYCFSFSEALAIARTIYLPCVFIELIMLSYRYLFGVKKSVQEVMLAQRQRLGYVGFRSSLRSFSTMLSAVLVKSLRLSTQNYQAMTTRAYQGVLYSPHQWNKSSGLNLLLIIAGAILIVCLSLISF